MHKRACICRSCKLCKNCIPGVKYWCGLISAGLLHHIENLDTFTNSDYFCRLASYRCTTELKRDVDCFWRIKNLDVSGRDV
jgi:hypothetical protein